MRKIDARDYPLEIDTPDGKKTITYQVRKSFSEIILAPQLKLNGTALLLNQKLALKILEGKEDFILLEEAEWVKLRGAVDVIEGWGFNDVEFVRRILEAPQVEVKG